MEYERTGGSEEEDEVEEEEELEEFELVRTCC